MNIVKNLSTGYNQSNRLNSIFSQNLKLQVDNGWKHNHQKKFLYYNLSNNLNFQNARKTEWQLLTELFSSVSSLPKISTHINGRTETGRRNPTIVNDKCVPISNPLPALSTLQSVFYETVNY